MTHKAAIVAVVHVADDLLAVTVRCCNDAKSDAVLTIGALARGAEAIDAEVEAHISRVEKTHAARQAAADHIERLLNR